MIQRAFIAAADCDQQCEPHGSAHDDMLTQKSRPLVPYLVILNSANQLYSGTGTALFEWIRFAKKRFLFALCMDNHSSLNYKIARDFCSKEGVTFLPSGPSMRDGAADPGVADAAAHVASGKWRVIEILSWANTATNLDVVSAVRSGRDILVFTPHTQPTWTMPGSQQFSLLEPGFDRILAASSLVCCDSPAEVAVVTDRVRTCRASFIPIGIDEAWYKLDEVSRNKQILMVADFREIRKRADLGIAAMVRLLERNNAFRAVLAGRNSDLVEVPEEFAHRFDRKGFVTAEQLRDLYQQSSVFLLLSDYEAFGIPIIEALSCGTPVVTTGTREVTSLFENMPGCHLVVNTDAQAVDQAVDSAIVDTDHAKISFTAHARFGSATAFSMKLNTINALLGQANTSSGSDWIVRTCAYFR